MSVNKKRKVILIYLLCCRRPVQIIHCYQSLSAMSDNFQQSFCTPSTICTERVTLASRSTSFTILFHSLNFTLVPPFNCALIAKMGIHRRFEFAICSFNILSTSRFPSRNPLSRSLLPQYSIPSSSPK